MPGAGHMANVENPKVFNGKLMEYLERCAD